MLVTVNPISGAYYNIGGTYTCTIGDILEMLLQLSPRKADIKIEIDPERLRPIDADLQIADICKFSKHTGWTPQIPVEQTMADLLQYWRDKVSSEGNRFLVR